MIFYKQFFQLSCINPFEKNLENQLTKCYQQAYTGIIPFSVLHTNGIIIMSDAQSLPTKRESTEDDGKATKKTKTPEKPATKKPKESESEDENVVDDSDEVEFGEDDEDDEDFEEEDDDFEVDSDEDDEVESEEESFSEDSSDRKKKKPRGKK